MAKPHGNVEVRIDARLIGAEQADVAGVLETRDHGAQPGDERALVVGPGLGCQPRDRGQRIDGRVAAQLGDRPVEHDVTVEDAAYGIGDRIVVVVAVDQHGENAGDRAAADGSRPRALQKFRQIGEHARRITARDGRPASFWSPRPGG